METLMIILKLAGILLLADFLTGCAHFWMDQYGREDMPILGKHVVEVNIVHHKDPRRLCANNYVNLTWTSWAFALVLVGLEWMVLGGVGWGGVVLGVYGSQANLIHKCAHQSREENGRIVSFLQDIGLIQSARHHDFHHYAPFDAHFCILTDWLNPVLEKIKFWEGVIVFFKFFGINPVAGQEVRKHV